MPRQAPGKTPALHGRVSVGIGSWTDKEYKGLLYPDGLADEERLKTYATWFTHVEVNSTAYRTPPRSEVEKWAAQTPDGFAFDVKLHQKLSRSPEKGATEGDYVAYLLRVMEPLIGTKKLGAFLLLMPSTFGPERHRLEEFDPLVDKLQGQPLALELRHKGWIEGERRETTLAYFRARKLVWVAVDMPQIPDSTLMPAVDEVTNPQLAYLRLHGRRRDWPELKEQKERHTYAYPEDELKEIEGRVRALAEKAEKVHVVANNHAQDFAPKTAMALQRLLGIEPKRR